MSAATVMPLTLFDHIIEDRPEWVAACEPYIARAARKLTPFQAWDLTVAGCPQPFDDHWWGPLLQHAARRGLIVKHSYGPSRRPETNGSPCVIWIGANT